MNSFIKDAFNAVSGEDFEEVPVEIEEFVESEDFLNLQPLSEYQYTIVKAMSQIYKYETLESLYGENKANERYKQTCNEIILQLGKGSGKDYTSTIAVAYIVYLLLCLKDPAKYYGKPSGDSIDIINIAVNADQAQRVFFNNLKTRIKKCRWFAGKYDPKMNEINFKKNINVYSGHSEREAFEGYNTLIVILDEISGFAMATNEELEQGKPPPKTSQAIYDMYSQSVTSRFASFGKLISLSFPRFKDDFIQQLYNNNVAEKEIVIRKHTFKLDPDLPEEYDDQNTFEIEWEEDHILRYRYQKTFALRRPSWEVNPTVDINDPAFIKAFSQNPGDALGRFACMPSNLAEGFFKNKKAIEETFVAQNGVDEDGIFLEKFQPREDIKYYMHVDLAQKHDHCAVALAHVEKWVEVRIGGDYTEIHPLIVIDAVRWWTPTSIKTVDFADVRDYIISVRRRGFNVRLVTFDRWNSHDTMNILEREHGINTDTLSVAKKHYDDFLSTMYDGRLVGPRIQLLIDELGELREIKGKIDHPRKGSKDLADAVCGAIFNAVAYTSKPQNEVVEAVTYADVRRRMREEEREKHKRQGGVIYAPKQRMPDELQDYLSQIRML